MNAILADLLKLQSYAGEEKSSPQMCRNVKKLRGRLPAAVLQTFDHYVDRHLAAVAALSESDGCGRCHIKLPRDNALRIRRDAEVLHTCPNCGCWLYAQVIVPPKPVSRLRRGKTGATRRCRGVQPSPENAAPLARAGNLSRLSPR
ncbi:MAG TPA: hypothetical protein VF988_04820 [Verrucomicrobiae bacterium]